MPYNPVEAAEALQSIDQQTLNQYMRNPPPGIPAYQVAAEVARRADMAKRFAALDAKQKTDQQAGTVIDEVMRALNPGSVNPAPANPSQLASRPIPSNITGANAPMSPPAMQPPAMRPPVNAGIASGMQAQPALSPQVMQAAGGTMGRTVYARHGGVPAGGVYARGSDALKKALEIAQGEGPLYSKSKRSFEGNPKDPYPEQELKRRAMLALLTKDAVADRSRASGGMGVSAFASNGTQGRTVYAQFGYPPEKVSEIPSEVLSLTPEQLEEARNMGVSSIEQYNAEIERRQQAADLSRKHRAALSGVKYPALEGTSTGAELLAKQGTRERMMRLGINPADPNAVAALADAEQGQLDAAQAYREAQAERGTLFGELPRAAILEEQVRQREGRQLEARREADRIASLTPEHEALRMAQFASTPSNVRKTGREDFEAMADVHSQLAKGFDVPQIEDAVRAVDKARGVNIGQAIAKLRNGVPLNEDEIKALQNEGIDIQGAQRTLQEHGDIPSNMSGVRQNILTTPSVRADDANLDQLGAGGITSREDLARKYLAESGWAKPEVSGTTYGSAGEEFDYGHLSASEIIAIEKEQERDRLNKLVFEARYGDQTTGPSAGDARGDPRSGILTATADAAGATEAAVTADAAGATAEVKDAGEAVVDPDARDGVVPSEVVLSGTKGQDTVANTINTNTAPPNDSPERQIDRNTIKFLDAVDSDKIRSDTYAALSKDSQEAFKRIEGQFDELKKYDPKADIKDIQQRRMDRIKQIKFDTNTQRLLAASAAFLGTSTFYEGFGKAMEAMGDLSKEEQKQVLALQDKIDESDLAARVAYIEHQAKMASMENNLLAARRADQRGNSEEASRRAALAVAERAAANDLLYKAEQLANTKAGQEIQRLAYTYEKRTETERAMDSFIKNQWRVLTPEQKVEFGWPEGATTIGQLDFSKASPQIKKYLDSIGLGKAASYAGSNFVISQAQRAQDTLIDIEKTGSDLFGDITSSKNTIPIDDLQTFVTALGNVDAKFAGMELPRQGKSNFLSPGKVTEKGKASGYKRAIELWAARKRLNQTSLMNERNAILNAYPELVDLDAWQREQEANAGQGTGDDGGPKTNRKPITEF